MAKRKKNTNFSNLSNADKLLLLDALDEQQRRLREQAATYTPNEGQQRVHASLAQTRAVFSGNGAGKSALAVNEALWFVKGFNPITKQFSPVPSRIIVLLDSPDKVETQWLPELQKWTNLKADQLHKNGKHFIQEITFDNGSHILFFSHHQDALTFESIEADVIICDEPPPRHIYVALRRGLRKKGSAPRVLIVGTPISSAWMRKEILEPWSKGELKDTECFVFPTEVNRKNLAENYIENFEKILTEKEKRIRLHGEFFDLEGLALAHLWNPFVHEIEPFEWPESNQCVVAIDPHPAKAHHAVLLGVDRDGYLYYLKELKEKCLAREFARRLKTWARGFRVVDWVSDSLGSSEYTGGEGFKSFIAVLNEEGINVRPTTWNEKNDEDFINRIQDALVIPELANNFGQRLPKLRVFRGNHGIINDVNNAQWIKIKNSDDYKPKLDISDKDFLSCVKYALATNLSPKKGNATIYRPIKLPTAYLGQDVNSRPRRFQTMRARRRNVNNKVNK